MSNKKQADAINAIKLLKDYVFEEPDACGGWEHKYSVACHKLNKVMDENAQLQKDRDSVKMDNYKYECFGGLKSQCKIMKEELAKYKTASSIETAERLERLQKQNSFKKKKIVKLEAMITKLNATIERHDGKLNHKDIEIAGYKTIIENHNQENKELIKQIEGNAHELVEYVNNEERIRSIMDKLLDKDMYDKIIQEFYSDNEHSASDKFENVEAPTPPPKKEKKKEPPVLELNSPESPKQIITGEGWTKCRQDILIENENDYIQLNEWGQTDKKTKNCILANIRKKHKKQINKKKHLIEYLIKLPSPHIIAGKAKNSPLCSFFYEYKLIIPITTP